LFIKSLAESIESSFTFSLLTEIELAVRAFLPPLDLKPVFSFKTATISTPASISSLAISA
jgi:hypothetical protein